MKKSILLFIAAVLGLTAGAQEKRLYDFVVPRDGTFRQALDAANGRRDTARRYRIFVMQGDYIIPTEGTTTGGDGKEYGDPRSYLKAPNTSIVGEDRDRTVLTNTVPEPTWDNGFGRANPLEGIGRGDVLIIERQSHSTYLQDLTMRSGMGDHTGRNIVLHDRSDLTVARNICIWAYQDTYVSNNQNGRFYFDGGIIRGRTDYICGKGDVVYNGVTFQQCGRGGYLAVPSVARRYGYVMLSCHIKSETPDVTYYLGRPWGKGTPRAVWIDTQVDRSPITRDKRGYNGWADMSGGWPALFTEYRTHLTTGEMLDLSGRRAMYVDKEGVEHPNHPVLTDSEAAKYTLANVMGDWHPEQLAREATAPADVRIKGKKLTWQGSPDALLYAVCRNGKVVDFTTKTSFRLKDSTPSDSWAVRAANQMGGLGRAVEATTPDKR